MRQIFPLAGPELELVPAVTAGPLPAAITELAALYRNGTHPATAGRGWLRANMIASADGASAFEGRSGGLGGPADRMVFMVLRSLADVILVGAGTARAEHYRPVGTADVWAGLRTGQPPAPAIAIVSRSLDLSACGQLLTPGAGYAQTIVITSAEAAARGAGELAGRALLVPAGDHDVNLSAAVAALVSLGFQQILTEGGPHLLAQLAGAGLVDELCLTTSPVLVGGSASRILAAPGPADRPAAEAQLSLAHVLADASFLLSRYIRPAD